MKFDAEANFARRIALAAGDNAVRIRADHFAVEMKPDKSPVTVADRDNERLIRQAIEAEFPHDGILGEEGTNVAGSSGRRWIIDPIDGTRDFIGLNRFWCVLIGLECDGEPAVGAANFPMLGELYWAARGEGAYLGTSRLQASVLATPSDRSLTPSALHRGHTRPYRNEIVDATGRRWAFSSYAGALDACLVAAGEADLWFESRAAPWDLAALKPILVESGADYFALDGSSSIYSGTVIACAPGVSEHVRAQFGVPGSKV